MGCMMNRRKLFPIGRGLKQLSSFFTRFTSHWTGWSRCKETKQAAQGYLSGIVLPGKRKNMSGVARRIHLDLNVVQQFITDSPWDPQKVMATTIQTMSKAIAKPEGVIIVDDTGQEKKGTKSPGVNRHTPGLLARPGIVRFLSDAGTASRGRVGMQMHGIGQLVYSCIYLRNGLKIGRDARKQGSLKMYGFKQNRRLV